MTMVKEMISPAFDAEVIVTPPNVSRVKMMLKIVPKNDAERNLSAVDVPQLRR